MVDKEYSKAASASAKRNMRRDVQAMSFPTHRYHCSFSLKATAACESRISKAVPLR